MRVALASALLFTSPSLLAQHEVLIAEGDLLPNGSVVLGIGDLALAPAGRWAATAEVGGTINNPEHTVLVDGQVLIAAGDPLPGPGPAVPLKGVSSLELGPDGRLLWVAEGSVPTSTTRASHVLLDLEPLLVVGTPALAAGLPSGSTWSEIWHATRTSTADVVVSAGYTGPGVNGSSDAAIVRFTPRAQGGFDAVAVYRSGDLLNGSSAPIQFFGQFRDSIAANASGQVAHFPLLGPGLIDAVYLDDDELAVENGPSALFGKAWDTFFRRTIALNDAGDVAFTGRYVADGLAAEQLVWNGVLVAATGSKLDAIAPYGLRAFGPGAPGTPSAPLRLDDSGRIYWYGTWDDPDQARDAGIFRDLELLVQEGVTVVQGETIIELSGSATSSAIGLDVEPNGGALGLRVVLDSGREAAVRIVEGGFTPIPGCAGNPGVLEPAFQGLAPKIGSNVPFVLDEAQAPGAVGAVFFSIAPAVPGSPCGLDLPGFGELLIDFGPASLLPGNNLFFPWAGFGAVTAVFPIPSAQVLIGAEFYAQGVYVDVTGAAPAEPLRATNALRIEIGG